jgi:tRNA-splicing ligase RtcB
MGFISTDIKVSEIKDIQTGNGNFIQAVVGDILRNIPVGFNHHKKAQDCEVLNTAKNEFDKYEANKELIDEIDSGYFQAGTLGGGNHFIELQIDDEGFLGIMIHSGSRRFGKNVCDLFHNKARDLNRKWKSEVPDYYRLAFLPMDSPEGIQYINWMNLALDFAKENRAKMMTAVKEILDRHMQKFTDIKYSYSEEINAHHNYAALEHHYNKNVWVHRKGAIRAKKGELGIIPGAMGSYSYIVEGLGNEMSFHSSSHGAGRVYSRKGALEAFSTEEVMADLKECGVVLGKHNKKDVAEESRFAYKNIDDVMNNQLDLVKPLKRLKTIGVVKG